MIQNHSLHSCSDVNDIQKVCSEIITKFDSIVMKPHRMMLETLRKEGKGL